VADRLLETKAWLLVALIFTGSLVLALVVPAVALWGIGQLGQGKKESFYLGILLCPLAVLAWAGVLGRLNLAYRQLTGRRDDEVLANSLAAAVILALVALVALIIITGSPDPLTGGPWSY